MAPCEHSEEDTRRRIDCLGLTDYEEAQVAEAKAKHPPQPQNGETSLHVAAMANDLASVKVFIHCGEFDARATDSGGWTALHWAAYSNDNPALIHAIVEAPHGLDVLNTRPNGHGWTPLFVAAFYNRPRCVEALISHETIDVMIKDGSGETALELATEEGHEECIRLLTDYNNTH